MDEKLLKKIKEDLQKSGFGSELKVAKIFEKSSFSTWVGSNYFDRDEGKSREIDLVARLDSTTLFKDVSYNYIFHNNLYIFAEVKKSEKPWVLFKSNNDDSLYHDYFVKSMTNIKLNKSNDVILFGEIKENLENINKKWTLKINGIHEAFKPPQNTSRWYGACVSATKAAFNTFDAHSSNVNEDEFTNESSIYQPLVVIDGSLVCAEMDENYDISLKEIKYGKISMSIETQSYSKVNCYVDIVSLDGLEDYIEMLKTRHRILNDAVLKVEEFDLTNCKSWSEC